MKIFKKIQVYATYRSLISPLKTYLDQKWNIRKRFFLENGSQKKSGIPIFVSVKIDFKPKAETRHKARSVQFSSVSQSCPTLCDPMDCSTPGLPVHHQLPESTQTHVHWISDAIQPSHPLSSLLLLPSVFPSIRVFSNASVLCIRWPKYWSFSFSISPSNEYSGLISFRMD